MVVLVIIVVAAILPVIAVVALRAWGQGVTRTEDELHGPDVRTMTYAVPPGRDPAELRAALVRAGYRVVEEDPVTLLVACPHDEDPARVRRILESA